MYNANYNLISENRGRHARTTFFVAFLLFKIAWGDAVGCGKKDRDAVVRRKTNGDAAGVWEKTKGRKDCRKKGKHPK